MAFALRVVCIFAVACGAAMAAPASSITYDQRQNGELNVHVDLSDVAILLLPGDGGEFAQRNSLTDRVFQILGRRSGGHSKKKHKNKECTSSSISSSSGTTAPTVTTTKVPDVTSIAETSQGYEEVMATEYETGDQKPAGDGQAENVAPAEDTTPVAAAAVTGNAVTVVEKTAVTGGSDDDGVTAEVEQIVEEHGDGDVTATATETAKTEAQPPSESAAGNRTGPGKTGGEPAEMVPVKTLEKPVADAAVGPAEAAGPAGAVGAAGAVGPAEGVAEKDATSSAAGGGEPTEMVAMKTMEKPGGGSPDVGADAKPAREQGRPPHDANVVVASRSAPKQTEMVAVKTMDSPATTTVITVKTAAAVKPGPKTNPANSASSPPPSSSSSSSTSSNGSSIMRKVADRKPLPSITLDVASPKVVLQ